MADVQKPICYADLLTANGLVVDLQQGVITSNKDQHLLLPCSLHILSTGIQHQPDQPPPGGGVPGHGEFGAVPAPAACFQTIDKAKSPPLYSKVSPLLDEKLAAAKATFAEIEVVGVICHSNPLWASPLHMVGKKNSGW